MAFPKNWRLYHLLEIEHDATSRQIHWMFRKVTLRKHFQMAYLVLYNDERKALYDIAGEDAYEYMHSGAWGPLMSLLGATGSIITYSVLLLIELALLIIFFALLGARVEEVLKVSWMNTIAPLFVAVIIMLLVALVAMLVNFFSSVPAELEMLWVDRVPPVCNFISALCYFIFPFVVASSLTPDTSAKIGSFEKMFCLLMIGDIVYYLGSLVWRWPRRIRAQMEVDKNEPSAIISYGFFVLAFVHIALAIASWALIGRRIDRSISITWYVVFVPFVLRAVVRIIEAILRSCLRYTIGIKDPIDVAFDSVGAFFTNGLWIISLYFVAVRIEQGNADVHMAYALIPIYIMLAFVFLATIFSLIYMLIRRRNLGRAENLGNRRWTPPQDKKEDDESDLGLPPTYGAAVAQRDWDELDDESSGGFPDSDMNDYEDAYPQLATDEEGNDSDDTYDYDHSPVEGESRRPLARKERQLADRRAPEGAWDDEEYEDEEFDEGDEEEEMTEKTNEEDQTDAAEETEDDEEDYDDAQNYDDTAELTEEHQQPAHADPRNMNRADELTDPGTDSDDSVDTMPLPATKKTDDTHQPDHGGNEPFAVDPPQSQIRVIAKTGPTRNSSTSDRLSEMEPYTSSSSAREL